MDWKLLLSTFGLIFVAELGDKTQLAVISLTSRTGKPFTIFLAAIVALGVITLLAALAGAALTRVVPLEWVSKGAAILFIAVGALMLAGKL